MKRVLILCNYQCGVAPGQRFRFEQYINILNQANIETTLAPFFAPWVWPILFKPGHTLEKIWAVLSGWARRLWMLRRVRRYDYVFIHLEAVPVGPPVVEWLLFALGCKVVYDLDDAIFLSRTSAANKIVAPLRWRSKVPYVTRRAFKVTACNPYLVNWAKQFNANVVLLPTTIDPRSYKRDAGRQPNCRPVIGWTGSRSNLSYLDLVWPALLRLEQTHDFEFRVICDEPPVAPGLKQYRFVQWRAETEAEDLAALDIGLMPVPDDLWAKGKVGLKAIQYAGFETVPVASDVASSPEVIVRGETGLLVKNECDDWHSALEWLLDHPETWRPLGRAAREYILERYSVPSQAATYIGLFE